jgi:hypothetical protein
MTDHIIQSVVTIATAIIGLAILAVLVSRNAQTGGVIAAAGSALANDISAAVSPITGMGARPVVNLGAGGFGLGGFSGLGAPISGIAG